MGLFDGWNIHARTATNDEADAAPYRPDAGRHLTDDQYDRWINGQ